MKQIDVLEHVARSKVVKDGLRLLQAVYRNGDKAPGEYYRALLVLSYQFTDIGATDDALKILDFIPADYFRFVLPVQMADDELLHTIARRTAEALVNEGHAAEPHYNSEHPIQLGVGRS